VNLKITLILAIATLISLPSFATKIAVEEDEVRAADAAWCKAAVAKDVDGYLSFFAEDGLELAPNSLPMTKPALRKLLLSEFSNPGYSVHWAARTIVVAEDGKLAYTIGAYDFTLNDSKGKPVTDHGKYVTVWKKQPDGKWKVAVDIYNSDPTAQAKP